MMRFRTSDLLLFTAIAAMYATGYAYAPIQAFKPIDLIWVLPPLTQAPLIFKWRRNVRKIGQVVCRWQSHHIRWIHLLFATIFLVACLTTSGTADSIVVSVGSMMLTHHFMFALFANLAIGAGGMANGPSLLSRDEYVFEFSESDRRLNFHRRPGARPLRFGQLPSGHVPVPKALIDAVAAWAAEEEPAENHGPRG